MTDEPSPFDDPEFIEMLKRSGIRHRPGMADELMAEIGPLLAADGVDLENPEQEMDLEELNAAMGRAIERRNMELVTPVADARALTVALLRDFIIAYSDGQLELGDTILGRLRSEPTSRNPSYSHLVGVALETLDGWYSDQELRTALSRVTFAGVPAEIRAAIADLEALARKGRAFRSIERLLLKHNGAIVASAGAHLMAVTVATVAADRQQSVRAALDELLPSEAISGGRGTGAAFGSSAVQQVSSHDHLRDFEDWLHEYEDITLSTPEDIKIFETIVNSAGLWNLDPFDANDFGDIIDMVLQLEDSAVVAWSLAVLHDYVHFRMEDDDAALWEEPHELISEIAGDTLGTPPEFQVLMERLQEIPAEARIAALMATPLLTGIPKLLEWIGHSKPVTGTGMPRRADIEAVAAMIGIDAQGVAKLPPVEEIESAIQALDLSKPAPPAPKLQVQSAKDIGELRAWWATLEAHAVIELTSTRVLPGPLSEVFAASQVDDLEAVEMLVVGFIREYLLGETDQYFGFIAVEHTIEQLLALVSEKEDSSNEVPFEPFSVRHLRSFESMGLLQIRESQPFIPEPIRPAMVLGAMLTLADLELAE